MVKIKSNSESLMKTAETIYYSGQGYIYRCPECDKVDRTGSIEMDEEVSCRFCKESFRAIVLANMNKVLYGVIQEINTLETGTPYGCSPEQLGKSDLVKAGKSVGIDVVGLVSKPKRNNGDSYFRPWRLDKKQLQELCETPKGKAIMAEVRKILMKPEDFDNNDDSYLCKEVWEEARMMVLMNENKGLNNKQKMDILREEGYNPYLEKGVVTVFFGSTYAPECDSWVYWK